MGDRRRFGGPDDHGSQRRGAAAEP
jgi:hypothetical protein